MDTRDKLNPGVWSSLKEDYRDIADSVHRGLSETSTYILKE